jgi:hypothetical protein
MMLQRAATPYVTPDSAMECDLVAKGVFQNRMVGYVFNPTSNMFTDDRGVMIAPAALRARASGAGQQITFTCAYSGGGRRIGIDRNSDGTLDGN